MDPNATLRILVKALERKDTVEASEAFYALIEWIKLGGFAPSFSPN